MGLAVSTKISSDSKTSKEIKMDKKPSQKSHKYALLLFAKGIKYGCSTDIAGNTSYGYGKLDEFGFWQYPLYFD